jgi:hypothetical protein
MISGWKRAAINNMAAAFGKDAGSTTRESDAETEKLHAKIGQLVVERKRWGGCVFQGDPASDSDNIRPPVPI